MTRDKIEKSLLDIGPIPSVEEIADAMKTIEGQASIGRELLKGGEFEAALSVYGDIIAQEPDHNEANRNIAAIWYKLGNKRDARELLQRFFARHPFSGYAVSGENNAPRVLKIRGFDATEIILGLGSGGYKRKFRGGHFTTDFLLKDPRFSIGTFTITRDNLQKKGIMPGHELILNTIADPDVEFKSLLSLERFLVRNPNTKIINHPERVFPTSRDQNWQHLNEMPGVKFPRTVRLSLEQAGIDEVVRSVRALGFESRFIIRLVGTQTGRSVALVQSSEDLEAYVGEYLNGTFYLIDYHQILWRNEFFRKLRLFHIDGKFYPVVCHLDRVWNVHGSNRKDIMRTREDLMSEEKRFLSDWRSYVGSRNVNHLQALAERVGLEFFGIDFTLDDDNRIFIYELNAAMRHSFDHSENFPYKLPYDEAISAAFTSMIERRLDLPIRGQATPS